MRKELGFTLIEILVVATIIALMTGGGLAAYVGFNKKQQLQQAGASLITELRNFQKKADSNQVPDNCDFTGYRVQIQSDNRTLKSRPLCGTGFNTDDYAVYFTLPGTLEFKSVVSFNFLPLSEGVVWVNGANSPIVIGRVGEENGEVVEIEVSSAGRISIQ